MTTYNNAYHAIKEEIYRDLQHVCDQELLVELLLLKEGYE